MPCTSRFAALAALAPAPQALAALLACARSHVVVSRSVASRTSPRSPPTPRARRVVAAVAASKCRVKNATVHWFSFLGLAKANNDI